MSVFGAKQKLKMITHEWLYPDWHLIEEINSRIRNILRHPLQAKSEQDHAENIKYIAYINEDFEEMCDNLREIELRINELRLLIPVVESRIKNGYIEIVARHEEGENTNQGIDPDIDDEDYNEDDENFEDGV